MRSLLFVLHQPSLGEPSCLGQVGEFLTAEELVSKSAEERFGRAVLPGIPRFDGEHFQARTLSVPTTVEQTIGSVQEPAASLTYHITFSARGADNQRLEKVYAFRQVDSRPGAKQISREVAILNDEGYLEAASLGPSENFQLTALDNNRTKGRALLMSANPLSSIFTIAGAPVEQ